MKGLWILAGLAAAAVVLTVVLVEESSADLERKFDATLRDRAAIEQALAECAEIVRWFSDRKPVERKKGELEQLRRRFEALEKAANAARDDEERDRDERRQLLAQLAGAFASLRADAEDLRARLREMRSYDEELRPLVARLGDVTRRISAAQNASSDPEFQQRSGELIEEARKFRSMAESALRTLADKIVEGRQIGQAALHELRDVLGRMERLLAEHPGAPREAAPVGGGR